MSVKVVGNHSKVSRIQTGYHSLDRAFANAAGDVGMPVGMGYEIFGLNHTGKSTFAYSLAGIMAAKCEGDIALADFEGYDEAFLMTVTEAVGFDGKIYIIQEEEDEEQLDGLIAHLQKKAAVGILDSIGAIAPMGEVNGDIGESNMGRRAFLMAQFARKGLRLFRFHTQKTILMVNHWYPKMGGYGYDTPGGEAKKYLASVRIKLQREETFPDKSYALLGTVVKNRWGYQDGTFRVFMLAGYGMHLGMSALWDCVKYKLCKRTKTGLVVGKENLGKLGIFAKLARDGQAEPFERFFKLLEGYEASTDGTVQDEPEGDDPEHTGDDGVADSDADPVTEGAGGD